MRQTVKLAMTGMLAIVGLWAAAPVFAQSAATAAPQPPRVQAGRGAPTVATPVAQPPAPAVHLPDPRMDPSDVNIKLLVKITDSASGGTSTKTVSVMMANRGNGRVRSSGVSSPSERGSELNVDARASLMKNGSISTSLTINYTPERSDEPSKLTSVSQSVDLFLKEGVATVITQAADPTKGTRSVTIEVTASVVK